MYVSIRYTIYIYILYGGTRYTYIYIYIHNWSFLIFFYCCTYMHERTYTHGCIRAEYICYTQAPWLCWQVLCLHHLQLLPAVAQLCRVMLGMCLAAASWQSKNGLLVTFPPSQGYPLWHSYAVWCWGCAWPLPAGSLRMDCLWPSLPLKAARCGTAMLCDAGDALGRCQLAV